MVGWKAKVLRGWHRGAVCTVIQNFGKTAVVRLAFACVKTVSKMHIRIAVSSLRKLSWQ
ncbi:MAG: hypothetical protein ACKESB_00755 [Candidatus Hodgkinia cicadicola]